MNSYKRLVVGRSLSGATWAPAYIAYGNNNRTACVRIPFGRIELRLPDGAANPYLATAALAAAGLDGIERRLDPGEPLNVNLYEWSEQQIRERGIGLLPQSLHEAIDALAADEVVQGGHRQRPGRGIHPAEAHGVDRVLPPRERVGEPALSRDVLGGIGMCGIVGLLLKAPSLRPRLGEFMVPMLVGMTERGPDSAGMAVFTDSVAEGRRKLSLYCADPAFDWPRLQRSLLELLGDAAFETKANHCIVTTRADEAKFAVGLPRNIQPSTC